MSDNWRDEAVCAETFPDLFFPERGGPVGEAKRLCFTCPVREQCLRYALETRQEHGIWGGLSAVERARLLRGAA